MSLFYYFTLQMSRSADTLKTSRPVGKLARQLERTKKCRKAREQWDSTRIISSKRNVRWRTVVSLGRVAGERGATGGRGASCGMVICSHQYDPQIFGSSPILRCFHAVFSLRVAFLPSMGGTSQIPSYRKPWSGRRSCRKLRRMLPFSLSRDFLWLTIF